MVPFLQIAIVFFDEYSSSFGLLRSENRRSVKWIIFLFCLILRLVFQRSHIGSFFLFNPFQELWSHSYRNSPLLGRHSHRLNCFHASIVDPLSSMCLHSRRFPRCSFFLELLVGCIPLMSETYSDFQRHSTPHRERTKSLQKEALALQQQTRQPYMIVFFSNW